MQVTILSRVREQIFDLTLHLFEVDVQFVAIDRTVGLEVEDHANSVAAQRLLIKHAFNRVNGLFVRVIPTRGELAILNPPAINRIARDPGSFSSVGNGSLNAQRLNEALFLSVTSVTSVPHSDESLARVN
jgi:hypothetical protein